MLNLVFDFANDEDAVGHYQKESAQSVYSA